MRTLSYMANTENTIKQGPQEMNCSFQNCKAPASVKVHYEGKEKARELCNPHYNREDEQGLKYYQVGTTQIEVLV